MPFLPTPHPERIQRIGNWGSLKPSDHVSSADNPMLSVGLQEYNGLLLSLPVVEVVFAIGTQAEPEANVLGVPPGLARTLALRLLEMCDAAEKKNAA